MLKKYFVLTIFFGFIQFIMAGGIFATTELKEDQERIQQERETIQAELSNAEDSLYELVQEREEINSELSNLNGAIEENEAMIADIEEKIEENNKAMNELEGELEQLQIDHEQRVDLLKDRARSYQKNGNHNVSYLEVILGSEGFGDFVSRLITITRISQADNQFIEQLEMNQQELLDVQEQYEAMLHDLVNQSIELELVHQEIEEQQQKTLQLKDEVQSNEKEQEALISRLTTEEKDLAMKEEDIRERIEEEARQEAIRLEEARREAERQAEIEARAKAEKERESVSRSSSNDNNTSSSNSEEENWRSFSATAYTAYCEGCSGVTSTGINLRSNPNANVIAVDPSVIPLGSRVEVKGIGTFLAADTGGAINGRKIDIFMSNQNDALAFGRRTVQLRVLD